jgi:hypothetical protein
LTYKAVITIFRRDYKDLLLRVKFLNIDLVAEIFKNILKKPSFFFGAFSKVLKVFVVGCLGDFFVKLFKSVENEIFWLFYGAFNSFWEMF